MTLKNYYEILGIPWGASDEELRSAFRRLARRYHPDVNQSADAEERFKEINEAYSVLSDEGKRTRYWQEWAEQHRPPEPSPTTEELDVLGTLSVPFDIAVLGKVMAVTYERRVPCPACHGRKRAIGHRCPICAGQGVRATKSQMNIKIPDGAEDGTVITVPGVGHVHPDTGQIGDLILTLQVQSHPQLRREGVDLVCDVSVHMVLAALGCEVTVPTLDGPQKMVIPPGTQPNTRFILSGMGVSFGTGRGDQIVRVAVTVPKPGLLEKPLLQLYRKVAIRGQQ